MIFNPETNRVITCLLTPEELAALQAAKHGWEVHTRHGWDYIYWPGWLAGSVYRAIPEPVTKPHVPNKVWAVLGPEWRWFTWDARGSVWLHTERPVPMHSTWSVCGKSRLVGNLFPSITRGTCDWHEAICKRPEGV